MCPEYQPFGAQRDRGNRCLEAKSPACYKLGMSKTAARWLLFKYLGGELTPLSKPFKTKKQAEKARLQYPERERKTIGLGVLRGDK